MEVRINKEVRSYTEAIFFGLNARQLLVMSKLFKQMTKLILAKNSGRHHDACCMKFFLYLPGGTP